MMYKTATTKKQFDLEQIPSKKPIVISLDKLPTRGDSGYFANDLAARNTTLKNIINQEDASKKKGTTDVSDIAKYCIQYHVGSVLGENVGGANYKVDLNLLRAAVVKDLESYFPKEKGLCGKYFDENIMPYILSDLQVKKK